MKHLAWAAMVFIAAGWLMPGAGLADIYKYVDEKGRVHYTNNPESIPGSSRNSIVVDKEVKNKPLLPAREPVAGPTEKVPGTAAEASADTGSPMVQLQKQHAYLENNRKQALAGQRQTLETERQALKTESIRLEEARRKANSEAEVKRYNADIALYNQRAADYQKQKASYQKDRDAFQKEVDAYEAELKKALESSLEDMNKKESVPDQVASPDETP